MQQLFEVEQYLLLGLEQASLPLLSEKALEVLVVAVLQDHIDTVMFSIPNHILQLYYVMVRLQLYHRLYLLPCRRNRVFYSLHLLN